MKTIAPSPVETQNVNEQTGSRLNWRHYLGMAAGVLAAGSVWALTDPEGARAFGEGLIDVVVPNFGSPVIEPQNGGPVMS